MVINPSGKSASVYVRSRGVEYTRQKEDSAIEITSSTSISIALVQFSR